MARKPPSYRLHRPSGLGVVRLDGRDHYLGKWGTPESRQEYDRLIARWLAGGRHLPPDKARLLVSELALAYLKHAASYYLGPDGKPTSEVHLTRRAVHYLKALYGGTPAETFGPLAFKSVRESIVQAGACRRTVNAYMQRVKLMFRWAAENELLPAAIWTALRAVPGLKRGRTPAPDHPRVLPAEREAVDAVLPLLPEPGELVARVQALAGMRPGEAVRLTAADIDRSREPWEYVPGRHKTAHHGIVRRIFFGPKARQILTPLLALRPDGPLFLDRRGNPLDVHRYGRWIKNACDALRAPRWHATQLRHGAATEARRLAGLEAAQQLLGHSTIRTTESVYAEPDLDLARLVAETIG